MSETVVPKIISDDAVWTDRRLLNVNHFEFAGIAYVPSCAEEHQARSHMVRERLLLCAGLKPMPDLSMGKVTVSEGKSYQDILIKGVSIESLPGLKLTGSLFVQKNITAPQPGIICPHGHWLHGRVHQDERGGVIKRCCELARLGFVVFAYDMIGYNDCNDLPHNWEGELRFKGDLAGISPFGLQTVNSRHAVDFLTSLPEVDPARIGCTGASGGASQSWFISALDDRIKAVAPVCMLSAHFMGGCGCEEGPLLRTTGLTSFDIVSALAPRPVLLPSVTGDWTNLNPDYEIPKLKEVYNLYNAAHLVENFHCTATHNYNQNTREHVYAWLVKQLKGIDCGMIIAEDPEVSPAPEMLWLEGKAPAEPDEKSAAEAYEKLAAHYACGVLDTGSDFIKWQRERALLLREILSSSAEIAAKDVVERVSPPTPWKVPGGLAAGRLVSRRMAGDVVPTVHITPDKEIDGQSVVLLAADRSYMEYFADADGAELIAAAMKKRRNLRLSELTGSGCRVGDLKRAIRNSARLGSAFNEPYFTMRVNDLLTVGTLLKERGFTAVQLMGEKSAALAVLAAGALTGMPVTVDLADIDDEVWRDELNYQPLIGRIGGLAGLLLLNIRPGSCFCRPQSKYAMLLKKYGAEISRSGLKSQF